MDPITESMLLFMLISIFGECLTMLFSLTGFFNLSDRDYATGRRLKAAFRGT